MGFFKNVREEFGTKTGKALGNALWGKAAEDYRIGIRQESDSQLQRNSDREAQILRGSEARHSIRKISEVEFDINDPDALATTLVALSTTVAALKSNEGGDNYDEMELAAAEAKFESGVALLKSLAPDHPILSHFTRVRNEADQKYNAKKKSARNFTLISLAVVIGVSLFSDAIYNLPGSLPSWFGFARFVAIFCIFIGVLRMIDIRSNHR